MWRQILVKSNQSVESEKLLSIGRNGYFPLRNRPDAETGERLMLLNYNFKMSNFCYSGTAKTAMGVFFFGDCISKEIVHF